MLNDDEHKSVSGANEMDPRHPSLLSDEVGQPHVVKARERYEGIVMQLRGKRARIVALGNGCFGVLRHGGHVAEGSVQEWAAAMHLGARVTVEVLRVVGDHYTGSHSIVLQLPEVADAIWSEVQQRHPIGSLVRGSIVWRGVGASILEMLDGASGWLPDSELTWSEDDHSVAKSLAVGQEMRVQVVGYMPEHRRLMLSLRQAEGGTFDGEIMAPQCPVGEMVEGTVVWLGDGGAVIRMASRSLGWLPDAELSWARKDRSARESLVIGQPIRLRVTGYDPEYRKLLLSLRQVEDHPVDGLDESTFVGTTHKGVVASIMDYGVFVRLPIGFNGLLHRSVMPEGLSLAEGDVLHVRVTGLDKVRRRIALAYVDDSE